MKSSTIILLTALGGLLLYLVSKTATTTAPAKTAAAPLPGALNPQAATTVATITALAPLAQSLFGAVGNGSTAGATTQPIATPGADTFVDPNTTINTGLDDPSTSALLGDIAALP